MKKTFYILVLGILIGSIICGGITYAMVRIQSEEVSYNDGTVKEALDFLYEKASMSGDCVSGVVQLTENATNEIGDEILDFTPSSFFIHNYFDPNEQNEVIAIYYNREMSTEQFLWVDISTAYAAHLPVKDTFTFDNNLRIFNSTYDRVKLVYFACK